MDTIYEQDIPNSPSNDENFEQYGETNGANEIKDNNINSYDDIQNSAQGGGGYQTITKEIGMDSDNHQTKGEESGQFGDFQPPTNTNGFYNENIQGQDTNKPQMDPSTDILQATSEGGITSVNYQNQNGFEIKDTPVSKDFTANEIQFNQGFTNNIQLGDNINNGGENFEQEVENTQKKDDSPMPETNQNYDQNEYTETNKSKSKTLEITSIEHLNKNSSYHELNPAIVNNTNVNDNNTGFDFSVNPPVVETTPTTNIQPIPFETGATNLNFTATSPFVDDEIIETIPPNIKVTTTGPIVETTPIIPTTSPIVSSVTETKTTTITTNVEKTNLEPNTEFNYTNLEPLPTYNPDLGINEHQITTNIETPATVVKETPAIVTPEVITTSQTASTPILSSLPPITTPIEQNITPEEPKKEEKKFEDKATQTDFDIGYHYYPPPPKVYDLPPTTITTTTDNIETTDNVGEIFTSTLVEKMLMPQTVTTTTTTVTSPPISQPVVTETPPVNIVKVPKIKKVIVPRVKKIYVPSKKKVYMKRSSSVPNNLVYGQKSISPQPANVVKIPMNVTPRSISPNPKSPTTTNILPYQTTSTTSSKVVPYSKNSYLATPGQVMPYQMTSTTSSLMPYQTKSFNKAPTPIAQTGFTIPKIIPYNQRSISPLQVSNLKTQNMVTPSVIQPMVYNRTYFAPGLSSLNRSSIYKASTYRDSNNLDAHKPYYKSMLGHSNLGGSVVNNIQRVGNMNIPFQYSSRSYSARKL